MVLAQPHLELSLEEPFRSTFQSTPKHLEALVKTLEVARTAPHGAQKTHFTLLPEYSIPAGQGIPRIEEALRSEDWPNRTIVIGGADGLTIPEYADLAATPHTTVDWDRNNPKTIPAGQWVNCAIIWTKGRDGSVKRWLQPKLYPAWPEEDATVLSMFRGSSVFVFKGRFNNGAPYRFAVLVCFDWVATIDGHKPWQALLEALSRQARPHDAELSISWLFVIQHNPRPSDGTFLAEIVDFFNQTTAPNVRRDRTCIVFANSAGRPEPGPTEYYGNTSLVLAQQTLFTPRTCPPTFCNGGQRFPERDSIRYHKDILFRERGACIHSFEQVNPASLIAGAAGRAAPLRSPAVFPINEQSDPRALGKPVPAAAKWLNDELDTLPAVPHTKVDTLLVSPLTGAHAKAIAGLRNTSSTFAQGAVSLAAPGATTPATPRASRPPRTADDWGNSESKAVLHLVHALSVLGVCSDELNVDDTSVHARIRVRGRVLDAVAILDEDHASCREHYERMLPAGRRGVLLVSRDSDNNHCSRQFQSFVRPEAGGGPRTGRDITKPHMPSWQIGYRDLLDILQSSDSLENARRQLHDKLT